MDGTLDPTDLLTAALMALASSCVLRLLLRSPLPDRTGRQAPAAPPSAHASQPQQAAVLHEPPRQYGPADATTWSADAWATWAAPDPVATGAPGALLVGESAPALAAARTAADRYGLDLGEAPGPVQVVGDAVNGPWPAARLVVVGSASSGVRDAAVQHAVRAQVPLLLTARPGGRTRA